MSVGKTLNNLRSLGKNGFTLLELILVLFLMGLIAGLVLPFVVSTLDRVKLQSEARQIASALQFARSEAITKKTLFTFNANIDQNHYWLAIPKEKEVTQTKILDETVRIRGYEGAEETLSDGTFIINFYPRGNSSAGTIHLQSSIDGKDAPAYAIIIDPITGKPTIKLLEE
ncbi:MAG: prepilin-type N-terminal cleavage/methylation domain-containing protein [Nitrospina sp.]|nr:prepilin-type N-terminal cleavage/methylation domain-containing protein [Nitrospina sp.]MBT6718323.1 prepilin-type N-terminal cleavage/methylation domain-containing protein [Nitrospina sp.]